MASERGGGRSGGGRERGGTASVWEWVVGAAGAVLVAGTVGFMVYEGLTREGGPPVLVVAVDSVHPGPGGFVVELTVENRGGETAAAVQVEGELRGIGGEPETVEAVIDYVPAHGHRRSGMVFRGDPRAGELEVRAVGFDMP